MPVRYSEESSGPDTRRARAREEVEETDSDYEHWTKDEIQDELEYRGLPKTGNKPQLIEMLVADDG